MLHKMHITRHASSQLPRVYSCALEAEPVTCGMSVPKVAEPNDINDGSLLDGDGVIVKLAQADTLCLFSADSSVVAELGDTNDDGQSMDMTFNRDDSENTSIRKSTGFESNGLLEPSEQKTRGLLTRAQCRYCLGKKPHTSPPTLVLQRPAISGLLGL